MIPFISWLPLLQQPRHLCNFALPVSAKNLKLGLTPTRYMTKSLYDLFLTSARTSRQALQASVTPRCLLADVVMLDSAIPSRGQMNFESTCPKRSRSTQSPHTFRPNCTSKAHFAASTQLHFALYGRGVARVFILVSQQIRRSPAEVLLREDSAMSKDRM